LSAVSRMEGTSEPPDGDLVTRFRGGDLAAFESLVERYEGALLRFARATLRNAAAAEDAVQETLLRLAKSPPDPAGNGAIGAWLFRVCRNLAYDNMKSEQRERQRREKVSRDEIDITAEHPAETREMHALVGRELERLPAKQREVLRLKVQEGLSYAQIAEVTGLKSGYIGWLVHTGMNALTDRLRAAGLLA